MPTSTKKEPRRRGRPKQFDESEVLDAITEVFWERGLSGTSLDALSSATGIARPSLYATFGDKEAMYLAGLRNFLGRIDAAMQPAVRRTAPLGQVLRRIYDVLIELYTGTDDLARGCLLVCTAATEAPTSEPVRDELASMLAEIDGRFERLLTRARDDGELDADADVKTLAAVLAGVTHSLAGRARAGATKKQLRKIAAAAVGTVAPS